MQLTHTILAIALAAGAASALPKCKGTESIACNNAEQVAHFNKVPELAKSFGQNQQQGLKLADLFEAASNEQRQEIALPQTHAGQEHDLTQTERYHQQPVDQKKYFTGNNARQQLDILCDEAAGSATAQQPTQNHINAQSLVGNLLSEKALLRQQQAKEQKLEPQRWQARDESSRIHMTSNAASASEHLTDLRVHRTQDKHINLNKQQLHNQEQQQSQTVQQVQQIQQMQAESELLTCLRAVMGDLHQ
jgi:hypothetical protein